MKKKLAILAVLLCGVFLFAACSAMVPTDFSANWLKNPSSIDDPAYYEKLVYSVGTTSNDVKDSVSKVEIDTDNSSLVIVTEKVPPFSHNGQNYTNVYKLTYTFTLSATYYYVDASGNETKVVAFGGANDTAESDADDPASIVREVCFNTADKDLQPIYSKTTIFSYSPTSMNGNHVDLYYYSCEIDYDAECKNATVKRTDLWGDLSDEDRKVSDTLSKTATTPIDATISNLQKNYTFIDEAQLFFAARGINYSENSSNTLATIAVSTALNTLDLTLSCSEIVESKGNFLLDGTQLSDQSISCANVSISLSGNGSNNGAAHKMLIAQKTSDTRSDYYALPLRIESPSLTFGMVYTLTSATHTRDDA